MPRPMSTAYAQVEENLVQIYVGTGREPKGPLKSISLYVEGCQAPKEHKSCRLTPSVAATAFLNSVLATHQCHKHKQSLNNGSPKVSGYQLCTGA